MGERAKHPKQKEREREKERKKGKTKSDFGLVREYGGGEESARAYVPRGGSAAEVTSLHG